MLTFNMGLRNGEEGKSEKEIRKQFSSWLLALPTAGHRAPRGEIFYCDCYALYN